MQRKELVYISHPSKGLPENTARIEKIIEALYKNDNFFNNYCIASPVHNFGFMYHTTEYYRGLTYCTDLLYHCDIMLVFGDWKNSTGCTKEIEFCKENNIPYIIIDDTTELTNNIVEGIIKEIKSTIAKRLVTYNP